MRGGRGVEAKDKLRGWGRESWNTIRSLCTEERSGAERELSGGSKEAGRKNCERGGWSRDRVVVVKCRSRKKRRDTGYSVEGVGDVGHVKVCLYLNDQVTLALRLPEAKTSGCLDSLPRYHLKAYTLSMRKAVISYSLRFNLLILHTQEERESGH